MNAPAADGASLRAALLPPPRHLDLLRGTVPAPRVVVPAPLAPDDPALERLRRALADLPPGDGPALTLELDARLGPEAHRLDLDPGAARLVAGDAAGLRHGLSTLAQWARVGRAPDGRLRAVRIEDAPDLPERGVMLDVARDRRPSLATLEDLIERLASWKVNRLQLYMEADFAYALEGADLVLRDRSPYTADELRRLDDFAAARGVELVPNQQSFGHLHHWLRHPRFRDLAEVPAGVEHPFSREVEPFSLNATDPRSLELLGRMYDELLPCLRSRTVNVGLDETFDLGLGGSREACEARGKARVYLEFLRAVHGLVTARGHRMQFWGDIVLEEPATIPELPRDAVAMVWGYEADFPFEERLPPFAASGLEFQVCPGTSTWNSFGGRVTNAVGNLTRAADAARRHGATGLLVTEWGDRGHLQPWSTMWPGLALGAAAGWGVDAAAEVGEGALAGWLDEHLFGDAAGVLGRALLELGRVTDALGDDCNNGHALFFAWTFAREPFPHPRVVGVTEGGLEAARAHLDGCLAGLDGARPTAADGDLVARELRLARDELRLAADLLAERRALPEGNRLTDLSPRTLGDLRARLAPLLEEHASVWRARHRPGGLADSLRWLDALA